MSSTRDAAAALLIRVDLGEGKEDVLGVDGSTPVGLFF
jgi:hypothetical protein